MDGLTFTCPVCGADVPRRAKACPDCGACEKSGWSQDRQYDGLNLGEDFTVQEYGRGARRPGLPRFWMVVGILVVVAMLLLTLRGLF